MQYIFISDNREIVEQLGNHFNMQFNAAGKFLYTANQKVFLLEKDFYTIEYEGSGYKFIPISAIKNFNIFVRIKKWTTINAIREHISVETIIINACSPTPKGQTSFHIFENSFLRKHDKSLIMQIKLNALTKDRIIEAIKNINLNTECSKLSSSYLFEIIVNKYWEDNVLKKYSSDVAPTFHELFLLRLINSTEERLADYTEKNVYKIVKNLKLNEDIKIPLTWFNKQTKDEAFEAPEIALDYINILRTKKLTITKLQDKQKSHKQPLLFNYHDILKLAIKKFSYNPESISTALNELYERSYITNPYTTSRHLNSRYIEYACTLVQSLNHIYELLKYIDYINDYGNVKPEDHQVFNDALSVDEHAILPTGKNPYIDGTLSYESVNIFHLISTRFLTIFMPAKQTRSIDIVGMVDGTNYFKGSKKFVVDLGWQVIDLKQTEFQHYLDTLENQNPYLMPLDLYESHEVDLLDIDQKLSTTNAPPLFNKSSIFEAMNSFGKTHVSVDMSVKHRNYGIGEPEERSEILTAALSKGLIIYDDNKYHTTGAGKTILNKIPAGLLDISIMTNYNLAKHNISNGKKTLNGALEQYLLALQNLIDNSFKTPTRRFINYDEIITSKRCPICKCKLRELPEFIGCIAYPKCKLSIPKQKKGVLLSEKNIQQLLETKSTELIDGFHFKNRISAAKLTLTDAGKVTFNFD